MRNILSSLIGCAVAPWLVGSAVAAEDFSDLRKEIEALRKEVSTAESESRVERQIDNAIDNRGVWTNGPVKTKSGSLKIGGLLQVWAYHIQNDSTGWVDINQITGEPGSGTAAVNETADNDSFRIRRAELRFTMDLTEHVRSHITLDLAREATAFPSYPSNLGSGIPGDSDVLFYEPCDCELDIPAPDIDRRGIHRPDGIANRILQEAWVEYYDYLPHHDVRIGAQRRRLGDEGSRDNAHLDFADRSMMTQLADVRDIGLQVHGFWWDNRINYWVGVYNGPGTAFQQRSNRSDTEDAKDVAATLSILALDNDCKWGTLELGYSILQGTHGESGGHRPGTNPVNGLNRRETNHQLQYAWANYRPAGDVRGWWIHGEWGQYRDRFAPNEAASGLSVTTVDPAEFSIQGWNVSTGYRISESIFADSTPRFVKPLEFAFRYDVMENLFFHDMVSPERRLDVYKTQVYTAGMNYYLRGHNAKVQLNYNWVLEEDRVDLDDRQVREVQNNVLVLSLQVGF